ncbi:MAG TPA: hypothetical protein VGM34_04415 [Chlamydiales bacterium]
MPQVSDIILVDGERYQVTYASDYQGLLFKGSKALKNQEAIKRSITQLAENWIKENQGAFANGATQVVTPSNSSLWKQFETSLLDATLPDPKMADQPHLSSSLVQFSFLSETPASKALDQHQHSKVARLPNESDHAFAMRITKDLLGNGKKKKKDFNETMQGVHLGTVPRANYGMNVMLPGGMEKFFRRKSFESHEVFAKNSKYVQGGITSSYNRYADTVMMMRAVVAPDNQSVDYYTGRVDNLDKAKELAIFMFRADCVNDPSLVDGTTCEFPFAVQSLLSMSGSEGKMFAKELEAYRALENAGPISVRISETVTVSVQFKPVAIAANQFNYMNTVEQLLPDALSGKKAADLAQKAADLALVKHAETFAKENELTFSQNAQIQDAIYHLIEERSQLKPWQIVINRAYLCHLLSLPLVLHCKSSIDRTGLAGGMITAMKQWLRAGKEVPQDKNGKYAVHEIVNVHIDAEGNPSSTGACAPFKELFACAVMKSLKCTEFSRGCSGYKWERGIGQHPALADLMPKSALNVSKSSVSTLKEFLPILSLAMTVSAFALGNLYLLLGPAAILLSFIFLLATKQIELKSASTVTATLTLLVTLYSAIYSSLVVGILLAVHGAALAALPYLAPLLLLLILGAAAAHKFKLPISSTLHALLFLPFKFFKGYYADDALKPLEENQLKEETGLLEPKGSGGGA